MSASVLDDSVVGSTILALLEISESWSGTAAQLLQKVRDRYPSPYDRHRLPETVQGLSNEVKRVEPDLRAKNIEVTKMRIRGQRTITIVRSPVSAGDAEEQRATAASMHWDDRDDFMTPVDGDNRDNWDDLDADPLFSDSNTPVDLGF